MQASVLRAVCSLNFVGIRRITDHIVIGEITLPFRTLHIYIYTCLNAFIAKNRSRLFLQYLVYLRYCKHVQLK